MPHIKLSAIEIDVQRPCEGGYVRPSVRIVGFLSCREGALCKEREASSSLWIWEYTNLNWLGPNSNGKSTQSNRAARSLQSGGSL